MPLAARTPSPFGASPDGRPVSAADETPEDPPALDPSTAAEDARTPRGATREGRQGRRRGGRRRRRAAPPGSSRSRSWRAATAACGAAKDCLLWYRLPITGVLGDGRAGTRREARTARAGALRPGPAQARRDRRPGVARYAVSGDGTRLVVRDRETRAGAAHRPVRLRRAPTRTSDADEYTVDTRRIVVTVDPAAEWRQMFDEAGRLMRDHFWVADMAGRRLGRRDGPVPPARRRGGQPRRPRRPAVGAAGRARHVPRVRHRGAADRRLRRASRAARRRPGARRGRLAGGAGAAARDVRAGGAQPAVGPGRRRARGRRDPGGRRAAGGPGAGPGAAAGRAGEASWWS